MPQLSIFSRITIMHFPNLYQLNLENTKINNIQRIVFLNCPLLINLNISFNQICSIKTFLNKSSYPNLKYVLLQNNYIKSLSFQKFETIKWQFFNIRLIQCQSPRILNEDMSILSKLQGRFCCCCRKQFQNQSVDKLKIRQDKVNQVLRK